MSIAIPLLLSPGSVGAGLSSTLSPTNLYYKEADMELVYSLEETAMAEGQPGDKCVSEKNLSSLPSSSQWLDSWFRSWTCVQFESVLDCLALLFPIQNTATGLLCNYLKCFMDCNMIQNVIYLTNYTAWLLSHNVKL